MVVLTNCTFDGHVANVERTMLECLAIKPDLIFLWDEAWFGFARFSPFLRRRTAMGAAAALRELMHDPEYRKRYEAFKAQRRRARPERPEAPRHAAPARPGQGARARLRDRLDAQVDVGSAPGLDHRRRGPGLPHGRGLFKEAFFTHTSTSPNLQIIASLDVARRQMELEGYELVGRAIQLALETRREINAHPLISKYFRVATPAEMIPAEYRKSGFTDWGAPGWTMSDTIAALDHDEFSLDPTRLTLLCGAAGYDGTQFKELLASEYDIQINKTSRNSVLLQININNTRSDFAHLIKALADMARAIEKRLAEGGDGRTRGVRGAREIAGRRRAGPARLPALPRRLPRDPKSDTQEGRMRDAFFMAYDAGNVEHVKLDSPEIDRAAEEGPELVSANFVIPYPPGFPIMVPGQVITKETITFMRKLDVKEIHGYDAAQGLSS